MASRTRILELAKYLNGDGWTEPAEILIESISLLDELEAARAELEALKVPLAIYEHHTKLLGAAEELERLAESTNELREMYLTEEFYGLRAFSPMLLSNSMKQRAAKLRQEAEDAQR